MKQSKRTQTQEKCAWTLELRSPIRKVTYPDREKELAPRELYYPVKPREFMARAPIAGQENLTYGKTIGLASRDFLYPET